MSSCPPLLAVLQLVHRQRGDSGDGCEIVLLGEAPGQNDQADGRDAEVGDGVALEHSPIIAEKWCRQKESNLLRSRTRGVLYL